jgi:hypothetical protein
MGDDEGILDDDDEDTTGAGEDECLSNNSGSEMRPDAHANNDSCPVCGKSLLGMFISVISIHYFTLTFQLSEYVPCAGN